VVDDEVTGADQEMLTTWYTERAVSFIERHKDQPFFCYVPHSMVHVPLFVSDKFRGKSGKGLFGDVVMEIDWSVGQILDALKDNGVDEDTMVVFTSDNGPWLSYGDHAGSAGIYREGKGTMFEGGVREPTVIRWPGRVPAGTTCDEFASTIDIVPTFAQLIDATLPEHKIDGHDIAPLLFGQDGAKSPHECFLHYYAGGQLQAVRDARWKLHFPHRYRTMAGKPGGEDGSPKPYSQGSIGLELFDLENDPGETTNVYEQFPAVARRLSQLAAVARLDLGDKLTKTKGGGIRPAAKLQKGDARLSW
jgi:arylsulfatase A-like enzyme